jgi:fatty-acyl-CoA synthase
MAFLERLRKEWLTLGGALRALNKTKPITRNPERLFTHVIEELASSDGARPALLSDEENYTYAQLNDRANRYAHWALAQGLEKGDVVALYMPNRPEYMAIWIGLTRVGVVVALLNTNLAGISLTHNINIVAPKHIIVATELEAAFNTARQGLEHDARLWSFGEGVSITDRLDKAVEDHPAIALTAAQRPYLTIEDNALYIYTSGTTGMPKAANVNHYRIMAISHGFSGAMNVQPSDRMYVCLPMYHTVGGLLAPGATLVGKGSVVIRDKFSAREFWDDIVRWECTLFQYIGELCRYLVNTPASPAEKKHKIRLCCGNGLRPDIWNAFKQRFKIPDILEFYAATEGNVALFNFDGTEGSVGRIPKWAERRFVVKIVKFDIENETAVRDIDGFCIECAPGETGEAIGQVLNDPTKPANRFEGYADKAASEKKLLRNAFAQGDVWFRTGDLMSKDAYGYFYFIDRVGDTFRWKGENVATSEIMSAVTSFPGIKDATIYGVDIPGHEGRAGMAAIVTEDALDKAAFHAHLKRHLPDYARPVFIRLQKEIPVTGTFKQKKTDLVKEGFDPAATHDEIWFSDPRNGSFQPVTAALYNEISSGSIRL